VIDDTALRRDVVDPVVAEAFGRRLVAVAPHLAFEADAAAVLQARGPGALLQEILGGLPPEPADRDIWLLLVAAAAAFPSADDVRATRRELARSDRAHAFSAFLSRALDPAIRSESLAEDLEVVVGGTVVDVDFCARHMHNTGIQRVVRQTVSRWAADPAASPTLVAWTDHGRIMRTLDSLERERVVDWNAAKDGPSGRADGETTSLIVPVSSTVAVVEVPRAELCGPLAALAEFSDNRVVTIGYDAIPVVSADTVPAAETERFVRYLSFIKHVDTVASISESVRDEFAGFATSVSPQGITGTVNVAVPLPVDSPDARPDARSTSTGRPLVLCVGSQEPRKNHDAVLYASEVLWREGHDFRVRFIGRGSLWFTKGFDKRIGALAKAGRDVAVLRGVDDEEMLAMYRDARFTVFPSLQEGYGLPVAESLAQNTPVITTAYGSTGEIARDGGCLTIDPRDDETLVVAMRRLITDEAEVAELIEQIAARPKRSWDDYAEELWQAFSRHPEESR
jgi:glycosyltransferase involved in cell wall biosynthesis